MANEQETPPTPPEPKTETPPTPPEKNTGKIEVDENEFQSMKSRLDEMEKRSKKKQAPPKQEPPTNQPAARVRSIDRLHRGFFGR